MIVRNHWITASIDGRANALTGGPKGKEDGFEMTIKQRSNGIVTTPIEVIGYTEKDDDGNIIIWTDVYHNDERVIHHRTRRDSK